MLVKIAVQAFALFVLCHLTFDTLHYLLHRMAKSKNSVLRSVGKLHQTHHAFYGRKLQINEDYNRANVIAHFLPEYGVQLVICLAAFFVFNPVAVAALLIYYTGMIAVNLINPLGNPHHLSQDKAAAPKAGFFDSACYHAYHHMYPNHFFASGTRLFDIVFGTACPLKGRIFAVSGMGGAFGQAMAAVLQQAGGTIMPLKHGQHFAPQNYVMADDVLGKADVLVLAHGSMDADMEEALLYSYVGLIDRFCALKKDARVPPEIWALGSEIELHPAMGDVMTRYRKAKLDYAAYGKAYYNHSRILYRHIVPSSFKTARYASRLVPASFYARKALFFIRRGACYVPTTVTGLAFLNYIRFRFFQKPASLHA